MGHVLDHVLGLGTRGHVRGHAEGGAGRDRRTVPAAAHVPAPTARAQGGDRGRLPSPMGGGPSRNQNPTASRALGRGLR